MCIQWKLNIMMRQNSQESKIKTYLCLVSLEMGLCLKGRCFLCLASHPLKDNIKSRTGIAQFGSFSMRFQSKSSSINNRHTGLSRF